MPIDMSNKSQSFDQRTAGSDDSTVSGIGSASTQSGISLSGFGTTNKLGPDLSGANNVTFGDAGAYQLARDFVTSYNETLSDLVSKQQAAASDASTQTTGLVTTLADKISALVESRNTEGESTRNNTLLYIALAIAAVFGIFFWRRNRS